MTISAQVFRIIFAKCELKKNFLVKIEVIYIVTFKKSLNDKFGNLKILKQLADC